MNSQSKKVIAGVLLAAVAVLGVRKMRSMSPGAVALMESRKRYNEAAKKKQERFMPGASSKSVIAQSQSVPTTQELKDQLAGIDYEASGAYWTADRLKKQIAAKEAAEIAEMERYAQEDTGVPIAITGSGRKGKVIGTGRALVGAGGALVSPYTKAALKYSAMPFQYVGGKIGALGSGIYGYMRVPDWAKRAWSGVSDTVSDLYANSPNMPGKDRLLGIVGSADTKIGNLPGVGPVWNELDPKYKILITGAVTAAAAGAGYAAYRYARGRGAMSPQAQQLTELTNEVKDLIVTKIGEVIGNSRAQRQFTERGTLSDGSLHISYEIGHVLNRLSNGLRSDVLEHLGNDGKSVNALDVDFLYRVYYKWESPESSGPDIFYTVWGIKTKSGNFVETDKKDPLQPSELDTLGFDYTGLLGSESQTPVMQEVDESPVPSRAWYNPRRYVG